MFRSRHPSADDRAPPHGGVPPYADNDRRQAPRVEKPGNLIRAMLGVYLGLITYASWYPFSGWQSSGLTPWAYLGAALPYYWTGFDVATNVAGYMPLGALLAAFFSRRMRGWTALLLAFVCGSSWSALMEAVQTYLPTRVSSNLDLLTNAGGTLLGALMLVAAMPFMPGAGRLRAWFSRSFFGGQGLGLLTLLIWPLAQLTPQSHLFGFGQVTALLSDWISGWQTEPFDMTVFMVGDLALSPEQYWLSETVITACGLTGALLAGFLLMRRAAPRFWLTTLWLLIVLAVKTLSCALLYGPDYGFVWLTPGALGGVVTGLLMLGGLQYAPVRAQRNLAILALLVSLLIVNVLPENPYFLSNLQTLSIGKFLNFNGAAKFIALIWPFMALAFLFRSYRYPPRRPGTNKDVKRHADLQ